MCSVPNNKGKPNSFCHSLLKMFLDIIDLQCCNHYHLVNDISSKFQPLMTTFHYIIIKMHNMPKINELNVSYNDNICKLIIHPHLLMRTVSEL
jgi:hypothetical protein